MRSREPLVHIRGAVREEIGRLPARWSRNPQAFTRPHHNGAPFTGGHCGLPVRHGVVMFEIHAAQPPYGLLGSNTRLTVDKAEGTRPATKRVVECTQPSPDHLSGEHDQSDHGRVTSGQEHELRPVASAPAIELARRPEVGSTWVSATTSGP